MEHSEALIDHRYLNLHNFQYNPRRVPAAFLTDGLCVIYARNDIIGSDYMLEQILSPDFRPFRTVPVVSR